VRLEDYAATPFGEARRTPGRRGYVAYFPALIPRSISLPAPTIRLLADAEAALGTLSGVGQLVPNPHLLIRPYLLREALASTRIEGTQASLTSRRSNGLINAGEALRQVERQGHTP
jgi:Fic family protein